MRACVLAETLSLHSAIQQVLDGFHSKKAQASIDALLLRLYEPLLFRGLAAANSNVRRNSLLTLFDAFPLQVHAEVASLCLEHFLVTISLSNVFPASEDYTIIDCI